MCYSLHRESEVLHINCCHRFPQRIQFIWANILSVWPYNSKTICSYTLKIFKGSHFTIPFTLYIWFNIKKPLFTIIKFY